jgi:hypothetical protein
VKWLTNWNNDARDHLAPALGLDYFENARPNVNDYTHWGKIKYANLTASNLGDDNIVIWIDDGLRGLKDEYSEYIDDESNTCYGAIFQRPNTFLVAPSKGMTSEDVAFVDSILKGSYDKKIYNPNDTVCFPKEKFK